MSTRRLPAQQFDRFVYAIPPSLSDIVLRAWGYDLRAEYLEIIRGASLPEGVPVVELATGSGRMASILARSGYLTISGDLEDGKLPEARNRIGPAHAGRVAFVRLNLECLPFASGSIGTIVCMNTLHELAHPDRAVAELLRIHSGAGPLVLGDFNAAGFEVMRQLHRLVYRNDHMRGTMPIRDARLLLEGRYRRIFEIATPLNTSLVATGAKAPSF